MSFPVEIYDTTLRDGAQAEGINLSAADKLRIAERLDAFGVRYIEGGWPGSSPKDMEFFKQAAKKKWKNALISSFSMTRRKGMSVEHDELMRLILEADTPAVTIVGKTWLLHVMEVLRVKPEENLSMISDTIRYLKDHGKTVIYDAEHSFDGFADEPEYAVATWQAAQKAGADCIVLCDTNGGRLPGEIAATTAAAKARLNCPLGIHTHNDCGLGVANAIAAVKAGATQVQGTINGFGERTGNCNLISLIPILQLKMGISAVPKASMPKLKDLSEFVDEVANIRHDPRAPWVGQSAFAHKGGMHVHAIEKISRSYEHISPESVGNVRRVLVSEMSGRTNILMKSKELGFRLEPDSIHAREIATKVKEREAQGYEYEAAEGSLALMIGQTLKKSEPSFFVETYHASIRHDKKESICEATIRVRVGEKIAHTVAEGDGPVNALDGALRLALSKFFPSLQKVSLTDYKVRIINGNSGTSAKTRVLITSSDGQREWGTVGVSANIIEASLEALVDSMEYALMGK